jgi:hypothetical protein
MKASVVRECRLFRVGSVSTRHLQCACRPYPFCGKPTNYFIFCSILFASSVSTSPQDWQKLSGWRYTFGSKRVWRAGSLIFREWKSKGVVEAKQEGGWRESSSVSDGEQHPVSQPQPQSQATGVGVTALTQLSTCLSGAVFGFSRLAKPKRILNFFFSASFGQ